MYSHLESSLARRSCSCGSMSDHRFLLILGKQDEAFLQRQNMHNFAKRSRGLNPSKSMIRNCTKVSRHQCDQIGQFVGLWATF